jgi:hypothetical protein
MIEELRRALNGRQWPEYAHQRLGPKVGDVVVPFLRPVIGAAVEQDAPRLGGSKIGGLPHADEAFVWPVEDGTDEPLALVCQLNLADAGEAGLRGLLYLFAIYDSDRAYGYEIDETAAKLVHVAEPGPLAEVERPEGLADDGVFPERRLRLGPSLCAEERFDYEVGHAIEQELLALGGVPCDTVRLLGAVHPFRDETREFLDGMQTQDFFCTSTATRRSDTPSARATSTPCWSGGSGGGQARRRRDPLWARDVGPHPMSTTRAQSGGGSS